MGVIKQQSSSSGVTRREILKCGLYGSLAAGLSGSLWLNGCGKLWSKQPNVIFISIDTLRADHLGCYGYERATSPFIDSLSADAVRFTRAYSETSWTLPSHMSMITSQYPHVHGVETDEQGLLESTKTLAEVLSEAGYHTSAFISWVYVGKQYGFGQGFNEFTELLPAEHLVDASTKWSYKAEQVTDAVLEWLRKSSEKPFFLFVHYFDPHVNYEPPAPYDRMFDPDYKGQAEGTFRWLRDYIKKPFHEPNTISPRDLQYITALYDGEIRYTDTHVERLFEGIDKMVGLDKCLVVLTGDHGEELNEHGSMEGHQWTLYEEVVHVPLIFRFPKKACAPMVVDTLAGLIDIGPTILDWLGIAKPVGFQGRTLMPAINGRQKQGAERILFAETRRHSIKQSIRTERYKLIRSEGIWASVPGVPVVGSYEMYDMKKDPAEQKNIYDKSSPVAKVLSSKLQAWKISGLDTDESEKRPKVELSPEEIKLLRSLGYVD